MQKSEKEKLVARLRRAADAQRRAYSGNLYHEGIAQGLDDAAGILGKVRCEEEPHWIPVDEKKPTPCEMVLLAVDDGSKAEIGAWDGNVWVGLQSRTKAEPLAWCPLPRLKPYEERREADAAH